MGLEVELRVVAYCDVCGESEDAAKFGPVASEEAGRAALVKAGWRFGVETVCLDCQPEPAAGG